MGVSVGGGAVRGVGGSRMPCAYQVHPFELLQALGLLLLPAQPQCLFDDFREQLVDHAEGLRQLVHRGWREP